jgi:hypothetical protein
MFNTFPLEAEQVDTSFKMYAASGDKNKYINVALSKGKVRQTNKNDNGFRELLLRP